MKIVAYIKEAIEELKKVQWLSRKQTINYTIAVFALSAGVAIFFMVMDLGLNKGLDYIIK
ncbi:MAG: preprotein translocase subunit SecE [Candidatus Magasanikbacteria bacterium RIFCSPHIGHO2_01_FULL_41_23]|uniref:Protein translocase subunit SecE n=1 Tax=Candidatus Magasanikbacteria bacterium RIFCSPLOWO2_01_FULL_40_15 TaxID=1798686 RepID=A0A1F6N530_9BACT|nr:MAG: preprotein translocase subunit SecE [Candidatus Magasanikbacteria bacterium RIFCSPHIGHO2_01_FULL_41_23]OGH66750.1 MAG: preprotein translocase subunit SecE [Candidatus Magasanikbacteria bacterium RIFCSPHIGHO2_02_FULL_41_35]OGH74549.1 MAG: preprotein translocase subunit SecE [Candidatus Magasanikbacteria bacterium RIFCSPHIGHO2_12_FULL_41_16]OGH78838.1 MAG: preprotein translocase subunit SecE [Candidatus Magasanikbacteria bacterium RIFCSPLOWO2_01_FULL_40_15]